MLYHPREKYPSVGATVIISIVGLFGVSLVLSVMNLSYSPAWILFVGSVLIGMGITVVYDYGKDRIK